MNRLEMDERKSKRVSGYSSDGDGNGVSSSVSDGEGVRSSTVDGGEYDTVWECVIPYVQDPLDRGSVSLVCKRWYEIDGITRRHVTMAICYAAEPRRLSRRFPYLESLKLKGKPGTAVLNLIPWDWGGFVTPWVYEIVRCFPRMKVLHFRRMIVKDSDLDLLANFLGKVLEVLRLHKCSGFSTDGLILICQLCRKLRTLFLEESSITENDAHWLYELASNNTSLESLNFYLTGFSHVTYRDLEEILRRCPSLSSMKISDCDISGLIGFFKAATSLEEFSGGPFSELPGYISEGVFNGQFERRGDIVLPPKLCRFCPTYLGNADMPILYPVASRLRKLDLLYALLDSEGHCILLQRCPNLEILETRNVIGDRGLEVLGEFCKKMKRFRIERGDFEQDMEEEEGVISQRGLVALAQGCLEIEYIEVYVSDITNASLECISRHSKNLRDFRLVLLDREETITDLPLDNGVRSLLMGCQELRRFSLNLRPGALTDLGLAYVGRYSPNVRWMRLGCLGESDEAFLEFSRGCPSLQKLEVIGCYFSEHALSLAALQLPSLRYLLVQGYWASENGRDLLTMVRPHWNIELIPAREGTVDHPDGDRVVDHPAQILAYYSLDGQRTDFPASALPFDKDRFLKS